MQMLIGSFITLLSSDINLHLFLTWDIQWSLTKTRDWNFVERTKTLLFYSLSSAFVTENL